MIDEAALACLSPATVLVNVSRGAIIDEAVPVRAVLAGRLGGVGLDVFSSEPLTKEGHVMSPLFGRQDMIFSPHLTFFTHEAMGRLSEDILARCDEILAGRPVTIRSYDPRLRRQSAPNPHFV